MTKTELARLVRKARSCGSFAVSAKEREFFCPVDRERKDAAGDRSLSHRFSVVCLPWEDPTTVAQVTKALARHLEDQEINGEPCSG